MMSQTIPGCRIVRHEDGTATIHLPSGENVHLEPAAPGSVSIAGTGAAVGEFLDACKAADAKAKGGPS